MDRPTLEAAHTIENATSGVTLVSPNYSPGFSFIKFPQNGTVSLYYGAGSPAPTSVYIFHQGGAQTPVSQGQGQYTVEDDAYLEILGNAASCKIQYYYL